MRYFLLVMLFPFSVLHAEPVLIFGLPLGGIPDPTIQVCKSSEIGSHTKLCLIGKPAEMDSGIKYGAINIPQSSLPEWAAYGSPRITFEKNGAIDSISINAKARDVLDIISSISHRFGAPTDSKLQNTRLKTASWHLENITISSVQVDDKCCEVNFRTPANVERMKKYYEDRKVTRPKSP